MILYFYPKDQTPGCTREAHNFQIDQPKYAERNAVVEIVIGVVVLITGPAGIGLFLLGVAVLMIGAAYYVRWFTTWLMRKTEEGQARRASSN